MSITWHCECGKSGKVPDEKAGKKGKCPACGRVIQVPFPEPAEESDVFELAEPEPVKRPGRSGTTVGPAFVPPPPPPGIKPATARSSPARPKAVVSAASVVQNEALTEKSVSGRWRGPRDFLYLVMLLALIPLGISLFRSGDDVKQRFERTVEKHPEIAVQVQASPAVLNKN